MAVGNKVEDSPHCLGSATFFPPSAERTLRLWVREGRIIPPPLKIGRTYYIDQDPQHVAEIAASERLVNRLRRT
ncbi:excisionase [Variovorax sp. H27-G14]|uniref:excisionase n=1 Tax=Variovorax sp. H27-G14 TaxID=3111914 RepID=UPI0038FC64B0